MRKRVILAMMMAVMIVVLTSCNLIIKDEEVDRLTPIIEVAGKVFTKGEVAAEVNYALEYQAYMYRMYNMPFDKTNKAAVASAQDETINNFIRQEVQEQKAAEMGMYVFNDDEQRELQTQADESYQTNFDSVKSYYFAETELVDDELDNAITAMMEELGYPNRAALLTQKETAKALEKLKAEVVKDIQVTDAEIFTKYSEEVEAAKTNYENNLTAYSSDVNSGKTIYYAPAGYRFVKNILRRISEEETANIDELKSQLTGKQAELSDIPNPNAASGLSDDGSEKNPDEADTETVEKLAETRAALETETADLQARLDEATKAAYDKVQPVIDEILQKLSEGESFDALMEEYGEDPGMQASPTKEQGYLVCEGDKTWVQEFTEAAMALKNVGDVSPEVRTNYGIHLLQYAGDLAEGSMPLEDVKDATSEAILTAKQNELYSSTLEQWVEDANPKIYKDRLK